MMSSDSMEQRIVYYLSQLREGDGEAAFHSLLELGAAAVPRLVHAFRSEQAPNVRAELVRILWNSRLLTIVPFLKEALADSDPRVWKSALDGLVTIGNTDATRALEESLIGIAGRGNEEEFSKWVREAIEQISEERNS